MTVRKKFNLSDTQVEAIKQFVTDLRTKYGPVYIPIFEYTFVEGGTVIVYDPKTDQELVIDAQEEVYKTPYKDL